MFATFAYSDEMVPVGDSQEKCVYFEIASSSDKNNPAAFKPLEDLPECSRSKNGWWNFHDPKVGVDVPTWYQEEHYISCSGKSCTDACTKKNGLWVWKADNSTGICYSYTVLTQICIKISKYDDGFGKTHWKYDGGCFADDEPGKYVDAKPGSIYRFENVTISVRANDDPFLTTSQGSSLKNEGKNSYSFVALLLFVVALGTGIAGGVYYKKLSKSGAEYSQSA